MGKDIQEIKRISLKKNEPFLISEKAYRHLSIRITKLLINTNVSANGVTVFGITLWVLAVPLMVMHYGILAAVLIQAGFILDHVDGELARYRGDRAIGGMFLDYVGHLIINPLLFLGYGISVYLTNDNIYSLYLSVIASLGVSAIGLGAKEHILVASLRDKSIDINDFKVRNALNDRPWIKTEQVSNKMVNKKNTLDKIFRFLSQFLFFPGFLVSISIILILNEFFSSIKLLSYQFDYNLLFLSIYALFTILSVPRNIKKNFKILNEIIRK